MPLVVVHDAKLQCTMGASPGTLAILPVVKIDNDHNPMATVQDYLPMVNIASFGMCHSPANPQVAAATAAAMGVLTPQPCVPNTSAPWTPGNPLITLNGKAVLTADSMCMCTWGGTITVTEAATTYVKDE